ncbi:phage antirepressor N-terminal domain-containing protein [Pseudodesulfovibrio senegalensis]
MELFVPRTALWVLLRRYILPVKPRHMCDAMGIAWPRQYQKIKEDKVLGATVTEMGTVGNDGKTRKHTMLPLSMLSGWLFKINPKRVAPSPSTRHHSFLAPLT